MDRRKFISDAAIGGSAMMLYGHIFTCCTSKGKPDIIIPKGASYKMDYITGNIGYFTEKGGTIGWMSSDKGIVIIDTQFPAQANNLIEELKKMTDHKIDAVINTHHHRDHTSGNIAFKGLTEKIIAHENSRINQENNAKATGNMNQILLPNTTFQDNFNLRLADESISLQYFGPAHTNGDIIVHFENSDVVHIGDLIFNRKFPYIDKGAGANIENWINILEKILEKYPDKTKFIFGHAGYGYNILGDKDDIKAFQHYLKQLLLYGEQCKKEGRSIEEALKIDTIPGAEEWTGEGIERSIKAVYLEMGL